MIQTSGHEAWILTKETLDDWLLPWLIGWTVGWLIGGLVDCQLISVID